MTKKNKLTIASAALAVLALVLTIIAFFGAVAEDTSHSVQGLIGAVCLVASVLLDLAADRVSN